MGRLRPPAVGFQECRAFTQDVIDVAIPDKKKAGYLAHEFVLENIVTAADPNN